MNTRRPNAKRVEEENVNQGVPQGNQAPQDGQAMVNPMVENLTQEKFRDIGPTVNPNVNSVSSRLRDFTRMNPPMFFGSKVGEDPQEFVEKVFKIIDAMGVTSLEKVELAIYQLKGVAQVRYTQWKRNRSEGAGLIESEKLQGNREVKRARTSEGNISNNKPGGQGRQGFKQRFSNQGSTSTPRVDKDRVSNPKSQGGNSGGSYVARPNCAKCGRKHEGKCLVGSDGCYSCGKSGLKIRDCPVLKVKGREDKQAHPSGSNSNAQKQNRSYALQS
uniref:Gag-pol polyprotein n=1 Tax=Solanum tuberosum TaxID=4113 RepID=M1DF71_SOLTU